VPVAPVLTKVVHFSQAREQRSVSGDAKR